MAFEKSIICPKTVKFSYFMREFFLSLWANNTHKLLSLDKGNFQFMRQPTIVCRPKHM